MEHAETADWLRGDEESRRLMAAAFLLNRDFAGAWQGYQDCARRGEPERWNIRHRERRSSDSGVV